MVIALALALAIGLSLGLLGGGGSILTVPILVYAAHLEPRDAIATSLFVVGVTSIAAMLGHARGGRVSYRIGALFGVASMLGAYAGGRVAHLIPSGVLLGAFTALMALTGLAMLRKRRAPVADEAPVANPEPRLARAAVVGLAIGVVTGVVGAGGGFVVVPALVLFSGLPMPRAIGTSLLVIAMNSFAGLAGAAAHATIPWTLAIAISAVAVAGSVGGARLAGRIRPDRLRIGFAWLVLAMAVFMLLKQLPLSTLMSQFTPWASLVGGALIGLSASVLLFFNGRVAGISGIVGGLVAPGARDRSWRAYFAIGMVAGGVALLVCRPHAFGETPVGVPLAIIAGLLVGFGTQLGSGCTSGHGVCGLSRRSLRSLAATLTFMVAAAVVVFVIHGPNGGAR